MESVSGEFPVVLTFYHLLFILSRKKKETNNKKNDRNFTSGLLGRMEGGLWGRRDAQKGLDTPSPFKFNQIVKFSLQRGHLLRDE